MVILCIKQLESLVTLCVCVCVRVCVCVSGTRKWVLKVKVHSEDIQELNGPAMKTAILKQVSHTSL